MIRIGRDPAAQETLQVNLNDPVKKLTYDILQNSSKIYQYQSADSLQFELDMRSFIVQRALELNASNFSFAVFKKSRCNEAYWIRTDEGGFRLRRGQSAYKAILDILQNSRAYATECATAIVIVFYLALTRMFSEDLFDKLFDNIYLMGWEYLDENLGIQVFKNLKDPLPGDCLYFENPDFDRDTPEWRGENVIMLGEDKYYGHGIGIRNSEGIIRSLNRNRNPGSTESAYLGNRVIRPNYRYLYSQLR
ncbi:MAG: protein-glutamine gamma-glutamyltransferase [Clostridia bacterium]|nr:protein-glutamine gamma-glutamyltransferase [Clostridia bacterium]